MEKHKAELKSRNGIIAFLLILVLIFAGLFAATSVYIIGYERGNKTKEADKNTTSQQDTNETISDTENINNDSAKEAIWYTCDAFKMKLPKSWENKYVVEIGDLGEGAGDSYNFKTASDNEYLFSIQLRVNKVEETTPFKYLGIYSNGTDKSYVYMVERQDAPANPEPYTSMMKDYQDYKDEIYINQVANETTKTESNTVTNNDVKIVKKLSPSGWAGSSMQEVRLYDNGEVYHVAYSGAGTTENDIIRKELIAKNADTIEYRMAGQAVDAIIVKGKNLEQVGENNDSWIIFEKN